jgi:[ribosomal protein S18]-alanine N-acetyltransferase
MYARFGFRPVGVRKGYYQETGEDAVIMWTEDIRSPAYRTVLDRIIAEVPERVRGR